MLTYIKYNDEKFAVLGDKKLYHSEINKIGGRWNSRMKSGPGWLVPVSNESDLKKLIRKAKKEHKLKMEAENLANKNNEDLPETEKVEDLPEVKEEEDLLKNNEDLLEQVLEMVENEDKNLEDATGEETQKVDENEVLENPDSPSRDPEDKEIDNTIIENECEIDIKNNTELKQNIDDNEENKTLTDLLKEEENYDSDSDKTSESNYDEIFGDFNTEIVCDVSEAETSPNNSENEMESPDHSETDVPSPTHSEAEVPSPTHSEPEVPSPDHNEPEVPSPDDNETEMTSPDHSDTEMTSHDSGNKDLAQHNESDDDTIINNIKDAETVIEFADIDSDDDSLVVENFLNNLLGDLSDEDERTRKLKKSKERFRRITKSRDMDKKKRQEKIKFKKQVIEAENARKNTSNDTSSFEFYKNLAFRSNDNGVSISDTSDSEYSDESDDYPSASTVKRKTKAEEIIDLETEIAQLRLENSKLSTQLKNIIQNY